MHNHNMVIGMDCGASHSVLKVWENGKVVLERHDLPGANFDLINQEKIRTQFLLEFERLSVYREAFIVIGMAGLDDTNEENEADGWFRRLLDTTITYSSLKVMSDCELLLWAGSNSGVGIALVAGTGSNCLSRNASGKMNKVGGMSHILSDEGAGFSLGWRCLHLVTKMADGRERSTDLVGEVLSFFNVKNIIELKNYLLNKDLKIEVAKLAPLLLAASERGEESAGKIVLEESGELVKMIEASNKYFDPEILPVFIAGSVFKNYAYREQFVLNLHCIYINQKVSVVNPIDGAWGYAQKR